MEEYTVKILAVTPVTHDVKQFVLEKPKGYTFVPGQATEVSINKEGWTGKKRPFTFTCLNDSDTLEFTIKRYPQHHGVTNELHTLAVNDELLIHDVWGAIEYKGKGVFIAAGAGITPFIAILRQLSKEKRLDGNTLIYSNKTFSDIILREELEKLLGSNLIHVLTREKVQGIHNKRIDKGFLTGQIKDFSQHFYLCGPDNFVEAVKTILIDCGANVDSVVIEK